MFCRAACEKPNDPSDPCICDNIAVAIDIEDDGKFLNSDAFFLLHQCSKRFFGRIQTSLHIYICQSQLKRNISMRAIQLITENGLCLKYGVHYCVA